MYSLIQSTRASGAAGEPLPVVFQSLARTGWVPRRGQTNLIAAGPGTGKSAFALNYAVRSRVPALYVSADSDSTTQLARAISIATGRLLSDSMRIAVSKNLSEVEESLAGIPLRLIYDGSPGFHRLSGAMEAYEEIYGDYPDLVIVDNVGNVRTDGAGEDEGLRSGQSVMKFLLTMARETESCVMALHHVNGTYNNADRPIPLNGVRDQITDDPEVVITLHRVATNDEFSSGPATIGASVVKNRGQQADPSGDTVAELTFHGDRMTITDLENSQ